MSLPADQNAAFDLNAPGMVWFQVYELPYERGTVYDIHSRVANTYNLEQTRAIIAELVERGSLFVWPGIGEPMYSARKPGI